MADFEVFLWGIKLSINLLFLKSVTTYKEISISKAFIFGTVSKSMTSISDVNTPYIFLKFCNTSNKEQQQK